MKDDQRIHTGVPYGNPRYVTPMVAAESHGETGDYFAPPYESSRATPADHMVEDDTYDWKHQAPNAPLPELHFDVREARTVEWAWWGIALQLALIPAWVVTLVFYILANLKWGTLTITAPLLILSIAGLANSIRSLIHFRRSPAPVLSLCLSLVGIGLGLVFMVYFAPTLIQRVSLAERGRKRSATAAAVGAGCTRPGEAHECSSAPSMPPHHFRVFRARSASSAILTAPTLSLAMGLDVPHVGVCHAPLHPLSPFLR